MRTFKAVVDGVTYELSTCNAVVNKANMVSGVPLHRVAVRGADFGFFVQAMIFAGLAEQGVEELNGEPLSYELIGKCGTLEEAMNNAIELMRAMTPDLPAEPEKKGKQAKNVKTEDPQKTS